MMAFAKVLLPLLALNLPLADSLSADSKQEVSASHFIFDSKKIEEFIKSEDGSSIRFDFSTLAEEQAKVLQELYPHLKVSFDEWKSFLGFHFYRRLRSPMRKSVAEAISQGVLSSLVDLGGSARGDSSLKFARPQSILELPEASLVLSYLRQLIREEKPEISDQAFQEFVSSLRFQAFHAGLGVAPKAWAFYPWPEVALEPSAQAFGFEDFRIKADSYIVGDARLPEDFVLSASVSVRMEADFSTKLNNYLMGRKQIIFLDGRLLSDTPSELFKRRLETILIDELRHAADAEFFPEVFSSYSPTQKYLERVAEQRSLAAGVKFYRDIYKMDYESVRFDFYHQLMGGDLRVEAPSSLTRKSSKLDEILRSAYFDQ